MVDPDQSAEIEVLLFDVLTATWLDIIQEIVSQEPDPNLRTDLSFQDDLLQIQEGIKDR